jgi:hypothetical protein
LAIQQRKSIAIEQKIVSRATSANDERRNQSGWYNGVRIFEESVPGARYQVVGCDHLSVINNQKKKQTKYK